MLGNFSVTGVGSVPCVSIPDALAFVEKHSPQIPYVPQLPRAGRFSQMLFEPFRGLESFIVAGEEGRRASIKKGAVEELSASIRELLREPIADPNIISAAEHFRASASNGKIAPLGFKSQLVGPITLLNHLQYVGKPAFRTPELVECIVQLLSKYAEAHCRMLRSLGGDSLLIFDEPALPFLRKADLAPNGAAVRALEQVLQTARACGVRTGIHCCAPIPGPFFDALFEELQVEALSFALIDPASGLDAAVDPALVRRMLSKGTVLWGVVPTQSSRATSSTQLIEWLDRARTDLELTHSDFAANSLITPQCGVGLLPPEQADHVFQLCNEISETLRCR